MRARRLAFVLGAAALAGSVAVAQPGRGGSQWLTALGDAQRTSWIRSDDRISVAALSAPGFGLQWTAALNAEPQSRRGLAQGVTAAGVTLFVPMSILTAGADAVYAVDNDIGHVVWQRRFDDGRAADTKACGGVSAAVTRIVPLEPRAGSGTATGSGRSVVGYRSLLGQPGEGVPVEGRGGRGRAGGGRAGAPAAAAAKPPAPPAGDAAQGGRRGAAPPESGAVRDALTPPPPPAQGRGVQAPERIPGAPKMDDAGAKFGAYGFLFRPSGVVYAVSGGGMLHVLGLASGKDLQRPARFLPPNARWSAPVAVGTTLYAATSGGCGGTPDGIWGIDLDSDEKPVVSWKTNGGAVVGAVAFTSDGTLVAAIGAGKTTGDGKANAIVALDPKTLQVKSWFSRADAEFATGPTIIRHGGREIVAAATKDGRVFLLDSNALGGPDHATPLFASNPFVSAGGSVSGDALAAWQSVAPAAQPGASTTGAPAGGAGGSWILLPISGRAAAGVPPTNGGVAAGAVIALRLRGSGAAPGVEPAWVSHDLASPAVPLVVNGVVFTLATGAAADAAGSGTPAVLHAYDGAAGTRLWTSGTAIAAPASRGSLWSGTGQVYVGAQDGRLYAFGFDDERSYTAPAGR